MDFWTNIVCIDVDPKKKSLITESNPNQNLKENNNNNNTENNVVISLKKKIKELNTELNKLRNDSNVQNYNILEMNYKLKNKEIIELKQENNYFRFQLEEQKNRKGGGGSSTKLAKNSYFPINYNKDKFFIKLNRKPKNVTFLKMPGNNNNKLAENKLNGFKINIKLKESYDKDETKDKIIDKDENKDKDVIKDIVKEEEDKDDLIKTLKFENDKLRKLGNENYSLRNKIEELNKAKKYIILK